MGLWLTNEAFACMVTFKIGLDPDAYLESFWLLLISGILLLLSGTLFLFFYRVDTFDHDLILHEQAIFLTSQYTNDLRHIMYLSDFKKELLEKKELEINANYSLKNAERQIFIKIEFEKILKQRYCPSTLECLAIENVKPMLLISICVFFK